METIFQFATIVAVFVLVINFMMIVLVNNYDYYNNHYYYMTRVHTAECNMCACLCRVLVVVFVVVSALTKRSNCTLPSSSLPSPLLSPSGVVVDARRRRLAR